MYDKDNVFAKIACGEIPCQKVFENEYALSFNDVNPLFATHVLVIPKGMYMNILDFTTNATPAEQAGFWECFKETARLLGIEDNFNVFANSGENAPFFTQSVFHFHLHLVAGPRNDTFRKIVGCMCK